MSGVYLAIAAALGALVGSPLYLTGHHIVLRVIARRHERQEAEQFATAVELHLRKGELGG